MPVRLGFVGAGGIANSHLRALANMPDAQVVAICDVDRSRAEKAAQPLGAQAHIHYRTMIENEKLDAIFVCVPPFAHGDIELLAAQAGLHLFIEKPIALSVEKARQILQATEKAGVVTSVGYHWRYMTGTDVARDMLDGKPLALVRGRWIGGMPGVDWWRVREKSGGQAVEQTTHLFDLARYFAGEVRLVYALAYQGILAGRVDNYNVDDASVVAMQFRNRAIGELTSADIARQGYGVKLALFSDDLAIEVTWSGIDILEKGKKTHIDHEGSPTEREDAAFLRAITTGDRSGIRSPYADALNTLAVTLAGNESMQTGKVVYLP
jgi:predicted dehydrogenase